MSRIDVGGDGGGQSNASPLRCAPNGSGRTGPTVCWHMLMEDLAQLADMPELAKSPPMFATEVVVKAAQRMAGMVREEVDALKQRAEAAEAELRRVCQEIGADPETWQAAAQQVRGKMCDYDAMTARVKELEITQACDRCEEKADA